MENVAEEYGIAYAEILEIIDRLNSIDYKKIPSELIEKFRKFKKNDYEFEYDDSKELYEQNISEKTKEVLAVLFMDYMATEDEKEVINKKQKEYIQKQEAIKREKYNPDDLFKNKQEEEKTSQEFRLVQIKKESFFTKLVNKIKSIFKK